jgi:hypothetical protein
MKLSVPLQIYKLNQTIFNMAKMVMKQNTFKSELFTSLAEINPFETISIDPTVLATTRSQICVWNKADPTGPQYKVIRIGEEVRVLK